MNLKRILGILMTAGLVLLIGSAGALDCESIPAGQAFGQAAFGLLLYGGCGLALRRIDERLAKRKRAAGGNPATLAPEKGKINNIHIISHNGGNVNDL